MRKKAVYCTILVIFVLVLVIIGVYLLKDYNFSLGSEITKGKSHMETDPEIEGAYPPGLDSNDMEDYPEAFKELLLKNPDAEDYVLNYHERKNDTSVGDLTSSETSGGIPQLYQWDDRWGYTDYGSGKLGITGCAPTCMSMVAVGLTGNADLNPAAAAKIAEENGYYVDGAGTDWSFMSDGASNFGLNVETVPLWEDTMIARLNNGHPIIVNVGEGDFTDDGHFMVITGYENGVFIINDPNSPTRSAKTWSYDTLEGQIRNMWSFST